MNNLSEGRLVNITERNEIISLLKKTDFDTLTKTEYFYIRLKQRNLDINRIKNVFYSFDSIIAIEARKKNKYGIFYETGSKKGFILCFIIDVKKGVVNSIFNVYESNTKIRKRILKKYLGYS